MKKTFLLLGLVIFLIMNASAQWTSPGTGRVYTMSMLSSDTIGAANALQTGNFSITESLTLSAGDTLLLDESVQNIQVADSVILTFHGVLRNLSSYNTLTISGLATDASVRFNIRFENANPSTLAHLTFENGNSIFLVESNITFDSCEFRNFKSAVIKYMTCNPIIQNCYFHNNQAAAINSAINVMGSPRIINNIFYNNVLANTNTPQINLGPGATDTIFILNNRIEGLSGTMSGGIAIADLAQVGNTKARISGNTILHNRYGYTQMGYNINALICDNIIKDNNLEVNPMNGGSGISIYGYSSTCAAKLRRNIISGNLWGITVINNMSLDMGTTNDYGNNVLYNNGNGGNVYALYNNTAININAVGNYWGGNSDSIAESVIFHQPDQSSLGLVSYLPINQLNPDIISFSFLAADNPQLSLDNIGVFSSDTNDLIIFQLDATTNPMTFVPTIELPLGVTCTPAGGEIQSFPFSVEVNYTVSTPHGTSKVWHVVTSPIDEVEDYNNLNISIYPNPIGNGIMNIYQNTESNLTIDVHNTLGKCLYHASTNSLHTVIDTRKWGKGLFLVTIIQGKDKITKKVVNY